MSRKPTPYVVEVTETVVHCSMRTEKNPHGLPSIARTYRILGGGPRPANDLPPGLERSAYEERVDETGTPLEFYTRSKPPSPSWDDVKRARRAVRYPLGKPSTTGKG